MTRTFWQELVLGLVVVVLAGYWISGAFAPNKDAQSAISDNTNTSIAAVKTVSSSGAPYTVVGSDVISTVSSLCKPDNTVYAVTIHSSVNVLTGTFTTSTTSTAPAGSLLTIVNDPAAWYTRSQTTVGAVTTIDFKKNS